MAWGPDQTVYILGYEAEGPVAHLWGLRPGQSPETVGGPVRNAYRFTVTGHLGVASSCGGPIEIIDLDHPEAWRSVGSGCGAALSPAGTRIASLDRTGVWTRSIEGGPRHRLLPFHRVPGLRSRDVSKRDAESEIAWGAGGIAFTLGPPDRQTLVLRTDSGRVDVIPVVGFVVQLAWQPHGRLLAFGVSSAFGGAPGNADVRLLDPDTGNTRQVAASHEFGQFQWSPDGRVLAVSKAVNTVVFVDPRGRQLGHVTVPGVVGGWSG
jgi:hypothetical protein